VVFHHDKRFNNPSGLALMLPDTLREEEADEKPVGNKSQFRGKGEIPPKWRSFPSNALDKPLPTPVILNPHGEFHFPEVRKQG
jgi:hypothetical protein